MTAGVGACHDAQPVNHPLATQSEGDAERPPLGSWPMTYALVCVSALLVIALLWWLSVAYEPGRVA